MKNAAIHLKKSGDKVMVIIRNISDMVILCPGWYVSIKGILHGKFREGFSEKVTFELRFKE